MPGSRLQMEDRSAPQSSEPNSTAMKKLQDSIRKRGEDRDGMKVSENSGVVCVSFREGAPALALITLDGKRWVLPWVHFLYAWYEDLSEIERIRLHYSTHEVFLEGVRFIRLVEQLSNFGVEWIRNYDKRYLPLSPSDMPFVAKIVVDEKSESKSTS